MVRDSFQPRRRSIRLQGYDYAKNGAYFITVCTWGRRQILGQVRNSAAVHSDFGRIVRQCWQDLPRHFAGVAIDCFVVMPDHLHGILLVNLLPNSCTGKGEACLAPTRSDAEASLGAIVGSLKSASARKINLCRGTPGAPVWQRNYHERIIREEEELQQIREYILTNPLRWEIRSGAK